MDNYKDILSKLIKDVELYLQTSKITPEVLELKKSLDGRRNEFHDYYEHEKEIETIRASFRQFYSETLKSFLEKAEKGKRGWRDKEVALTRVERKFWEITGGERWKEVTSSKDWLKLVGSAFIGWYHAKNK